MLVTATLPWFTFSRKRKFTESAPYHLEHICKKVTIGPSQSLMETWGQYLTVSLYLSLLPTFFLSLSPTLFFSFSRFPSLPLYSSLSFHLIVSLLKWLETLFDVLLLELLLLLKSGDLMIETSFGHAQDRHLLPGSQTATARSCWSFPSSRRGSTRKSSRETSPSRRRKRLRRKNFRSKRSSLWPEFFARRRSRRWSRTSRRCRSVRWRRWRRGGRCPATTRADGRPATGLCWFGSWLKGSETKWNAHTDRQRTIVVTNTFPMLVMLWQDGIRQKVWLGFEYWC